MRKASIVTIGNEILSGRTLDTNLSYLCGELLEQGIPVVSSYTVGDELELIVGALNKALADAEVVITTGGLGPTDDDLTRQAVSKLLDAELELRKELLEQIQEFFIRRDLQMPERNKIQAYIPAGAEPLENTCGTAAGIAAKVGGKLLIALPGVPGEMKQMFKQAGRERLKSYAVEQGVALREISCFGAGESSIADLLGGLMGRSRNPLINLTASGGVITVTILATGKNKAAAEQLGAKDERKLRVKLGGLVFGTKGQSLAEVVGEKLVRQKKTIAVAESCTGGVLSKLITDVPGSSRYFTYGWVTYSNQAKHSELGVSEEVIDRYGAVSDEVAAAMARGARAKAGADFAIAITGIAGPGGGNEQKPVGLVYICVNSEIGTQTKGFIVPGDRETVRLSAAHTALNMLRMQLCEED